MFNPVIQDAVSHMGIAEHVRHLAEEMFAEFILACPMVANNRKTAFAACVYYASNNTERKRSMEEIAAAFEVRPLRPRFARRLASLRTRTMVCGGCGVIGCLEFVFGSLVCVD